MILIVFGLILDMDLQRSIPDCPGRRTSSRAKCIWCCLITESAVSTSPATKVINPLFSNPLERIWVIVSSSSTMRTFRESSFFVSDFGSDFLSILDSFFDSFLDLFRRIFRSVDFPKMFVFRRENSYFHVLTGSSVLLLLVVFRVSFLIDFRPRCGLILTNCLKLFSSKNN